MKKIGILTFHYSNNYGGVLQTVALQNVIESMGYDVEVVDFVPASYRPISNIDFVSLIKNLIKKRLDDPNIINLARKVIIVKSYSKNTIKKFNAYRAREMKLSKRVDDNSIKALLNNYELIVVGSDQIWNPSQRRRPEYFLDYGEDLKIKRISYAADSTVKDVETENMSNLRVALERFNYISVRNEHSYEFVKSITGKETDIVADPTVLYDFNCDKQDNTEEYILAYIIGKEINGTHVKAFEKIKRIYGKLPVYSIKVPDIKTELSGFADKVFYDLDPEEWLEMFRNAKFIYTDSYHGVLFSLKYHKPFLAYYTEAMRATRFKDLGERYGVGKQIVTSVEEIEQKGSLESKIDFSVTDNLLENHKEQSLKIFQKVLTDNI